MQARRRAQPSGTNSPSSSHPRLKHRARCAIFRPCPPCGRQGRPGQGFLAGFIEKPRGSAPRERDHRGGDHPVPSRTRQLSPPSPRVLQRKAAGGQGVALAEGAFLCLRGSAREEMCGGAPHSPGEARGGDAAPCGPFLRFGVLPCVAGPPTSAFHGQRLRPFLCSGRVLPKGARLPQEPEDSWGVFASLFCISELMRRAQNGRSNRFTDETWRRI